VSVPLLLRPTYQLEISLRTASMLKAQNIRYIGDLVYRTEVELSRWPGISTTTVTEIKEAAEHLLHR
jgi:DNA-directed RNA polymerase subunit alpha